MVQHINNIIIADSLAEIMQLPNATEDMLYLCYCEKGCLDVRINDKSHHVEAGNMLLVLPDTLVQDICEGEDNLLTILGTQYDYIDHVMTSFFRQEPHWWDKRSYALKHPVVKLNDKQIELVRYYRLLYRAYMTAEQTEYRKKIIQTMVIANAYEVFAYLEEQLPQVEAEEDHIGRKDYIFKQFLDMLHKEYPVHRKVQWYADRLHISSKYLSAVCRKVSGLTAMDWIHSVLQDEIKRLLTTSDLSVKEIVFRLDFPNLSFFGRYVRKHLGMSPTDYRSQHHK
ncbi:MAG: helix-turn-helix domain-containing protein [Candidatus Limimorpha sp.]